MRRRHPTRRRARAGQGSRAASAAVLDRLARPGRGPIAVPRTRASRSRGQAARNGRSGAQTPARPALPQSRVAAILAPATPKPADKGTNPSHLRQRLADPWLLAALAISIVGFVLREVGTGYGLPYHYYWDEPTIMNRAVRMSSGDFDPHVFFYPGLSFYVTFVTESMLYVVGHLLRIYPSVTAFAVAYFTDSTPFYVLGRTLGALLGAATIMVCYLVGRRFFAPPAVAVLAALLLAVAPLHVANAHAITNDVPMAFFVMLAYVWLWDVYTRGRRRDYVAAGVIIGLGIATKYLPALLLVPLALAHVFRVHRQTGRWRLRHTEWAPLALGVGSALVTFCVTSPYNILDWRAAIHDYSVQSQLSSAAGSPNAPLNFGAYLTQYLPWSLGLPVYLTALAGLIGLWRASGERRLQLALLAAYPLIFFLVIGSERQAWDRWLVTLMPFLALDAAAVVWWCAGQATTLRRWRAPRARGGRAVVFSVALAALTLWLVVPPAVTSVRYDAYLTHQDSRTEALNWFVAHVPSGTTIAVQPLYQRYFTNAPIMTTSQLATLEKDIPTSKPAVLQAVDAYYRARPLYPDVPFVYDVATLRAEGVRYVVLSSASYHADTDPATADRFYAALKRTGHLVALFTPPDADVYTAGPTITIYTLP